MCNGAILTTPNCQLPTLQVGSRDPTRQLTPVKLDALRSKIVAIMEICGIYMHAVQNIFLGDCAMKFPLLPGEALKDVRSKIKEVLADKCRYQKARRAAPGV